MSASSEHEDAEHTAQLPTQPSGAAVPAASPQPVRLTVNRTIDGGLPEAAAQLADALWPGLRGVYATEGERTTATERKEPMPTTLASMLGVPDLGGQVVDERPDEVHLVPCIAREAGTRVLLTHSLALLRPTHRTHTHLAPALPTPWTRPRYPAYGIGVRCDTDTWGSALPTPPSACGVRCLCHLA